MQSTCDELKKLIVKMNDMNILIAVYNAQLAEHMRRSETLEKGLEKIEQRTFSISNRQNVIIGSLGIIQIVVFALMKSGIL